jgi:hypothetical protein
MYNECPGSDDDSAAEEIDMCLENF